MTYVTGNIPVGAYSRARLSNIGIGHGAVDAGGGYTYFNEQTGYEFSTIAGLTYNFINPYTEYRNGIDVHLDWGASRFLTKQLQIGLVGYHYNQASCDGGAGYRVGCFQSRVASAGGHLGYTVPMGDLDANVNLKAYCVRQNARPAPADLPWLAGPRWPDQRSAAAPCEAQRERRSRMDRRLCCSFRPDRTRDRTTPTGSRCTHDTSSGPCAA